MTFFVRGGSAWGRTRSGRRRTGPQTRRGIPVKWVGPLRPGEQKRLGCAGRRSRSRRGAGGGGVCSVYLSGTRVRGADAGTDWPFAPTGDLARGSNRPCLCPKEGVGMWVQGQISPASSCLVLGAWIQRVLGEVTHLSYEPLGETEVPWGQWLALQMGSTNQVFQCPAGVWWWSMCVCVLLAWGHLSSTLAVAGRRVSCWRSQTPQPASTVDSALPSAEPLEPSRQPGVQSVPVSPVDSLGWCPVESVSSEDACVRSPCEVPCVPGFVGGLRVWS